MKSREVILNKIKDALNSPSQINSSDVNLTHDIQRGIDAITPSSIDGLWKQFQKELESIAGEIYFVNNISSGAQLVAKFLKEKSIRKITISGEKICEKISGLVRSKLPDLEIVAATTLKYEKRKSELAVTEAAIVHPSFAVADIGSLVFLYDHSGTSYPHFLCDSTFVFINQNQIVANQFELFEKLDPLNAMNMVFITGPSRTADIEKVLVLGAHGPRNLVVIAYSEDNE